MSDDQLNDQQHHQPSGQATPEELEKFWNWFAENGSRLQTLMYGENDEDRQAAAQELRAASEATHSDVTLEFSHTEPDEPKQLIVTADGKFQLVDDVKRFVASAPEIEGWMILAFRPRMETGGMAIELGGERIDSADIHFQLQESRFGVDLKLLVQGLNDENYEMRSLGASLLAEHAVGEETALTLLSSLKVVELPEPPVQDVFPFDDLVSILDEAKRQRFPEPGNMELDMENDWQRGKGTLNDAPVLILLNAGLLPIAGHPQYDKRITVEIYFQDTFPNGMPSNEQEFDQVCDLGDAITRELEMEQETFMGVTVTGSGKRELVCYTSNVESALEKIASVIAPYPQQVDTIVEFDTYWGFYRTFCSVEEDSEESGEEFE